MLIYNTATLRKIFDRTSGKCHICGKKLAFSNYGKPGTRGAWEVEHSNPKVKGGSDHGNNLYAAHTSCNRSKRGGSTRSARAQHGRTRAPLSVVNTEKTRMKNTAAGAGVGLAIGAAIGGPPGALIGSGIGAFIGHSANPDQ